MLTYAALKFTCDPCNVYVIRTKRSRRHLRYGKKFFVDRLMCLARWSCKQDCRCGDAVVDDNDHLDADDDDDFREAEVLLMGNSRRNIVNLVRQYHPNLNVMKAIKQPAIIKETIKGEEPEKKRKSDKLPLLKSSRECKMMKEQFDCEVENDQNQLNRRIEDVNEIISTPLERSFEIKAVLSGNLQSISSQDYNDNAITDTRTAVDA